MNKPFFELNGAFSFHELWHVEDLMYYDGPLLFIVKNKAGRLFFVQSLGTDKPGINWKTEIWMMAEINPQGIRDLKNKTLPLRDAFMKNEVVWYIEHEKSAVSETIARVQVSDVPDDDLPDAGVFLDWNEVTPNAADR